MTTKPLQPATPLELCVCDDIVYPRGGHEDGQDWIADCRATPCYADDIAMRWNAYPRLLEERAELVAALRGAVFDFESATLRARDDEVPPYTVIEGERQEERRALLAKLGAE